MIISLEQAKDILRIDGDNHNEIITSLIEAIPDYLEVTTGKRWDDNDDTIHPLAQTVSKFILMLWFAPQDKEVEKLKRTIEGLLTALTAIGRG